MNYTNEQIKKPSPNSDIKDVMEELHHNIMINRELIAILEDRTSPIRLESPTVATTASDKPRPPLSQIEASIWDYKETVQRNNNAINHILETLRL
jgi:hypothetical protein